LLQHIKNLDAKAYAMSVAEQIAELPQDQQMAFFTMRLHSNSFMRVGKNSYLAMRGSLPGSPWYTPVMKKAIKARRPEDALQRGT
jgi:hypothetical protein